MPPDQKDAVRAQAISFLRETDPEQAQRAVRINALSCRAGLEDLAALVRAAPRAGMVMLPKVAEAAELRLMDSLLSEAGSGLELAALIETLEGLENVAEIAASTERLRLLVFGAVDLSAEMGAENAEAPMSYARGRLVHAGKRAGLDVMDVPSLDFRNVEAVDQAARLARRLGFTGKAAIHPLTISTINAAFTPSAAEIEEAERVIFAFEASPNGLVVIDGQLIEAPVVKAMQRRLAIAAVSARAGMPK